MLNTKRCAKWSKDAQNFFNTASDESIVLDIVISYGNTSQTCESFEALVNLINSENIERKLKKINIADTTYLHRHEVPKLSEYSNSNIPTPWLLDNKDSIENLVVDTTVKSWTEALDSSEFFYWQEQIKRDFIGDETGKGVIQEFRNLVLFEANKFASKGSGTLKQCIDFILEECAYTCAFFKNVNMVYPMKLGAPLSFVNEYYKLNIRLFNYKLPSQLQASRLHKEHYKKQVIDQEIISFMAERSTNVNFFAIDREGNFIYKNEECNKVINHNDAKRLPKKTWAITSEVFRTGKQIIEEEESTEGLHYLSVKSPLIVDGTVEGVIGLAVNITDQKRAEQLEKEKELLEFEQALKEKIFKKRRMYMGRIGHDIMSPLCMILQMIRSHRTKLGEEAYLELEDRVNKALDVAELICSEADEETIANKLKIDVSNFVKETGTMPIKPILEDLIKQKETEYKDKPVEFRCQIENTKSLIIGNDLEFRRTISNVINNAVEAHEGKPAIVEIILKEKEDRVVLDIKDYGVGMPKEMVEKLLKFEGVDSTKSAGHGFGTQQITESLQYFGALLAIDSILGQGTTFSISFKKG